MKEIVINIEGEIGQDNNTCEAIQKEIVPYSGMAIKVIVNIRSTGGLLDEALKIYDYLHWLSELPDIVVETSISQRYTPSIAEVFSTKRP